MVIRQTGQTFESAFGVVRPVCVVCAVFSRRITSLSPAAAAAACAVFCAAIIDVSAGTNNYTYQFCRRTSTFSAMSARIINAKIINFAIDKLSLNTRTLDMSTNLLCLRVYA